MNSIINGSNTLDKETFVDRDSYEVGSSTGDGKAKIRRTLRTLIDQYQRVFGGPLAPNGLVTLGPETCAKIAIIIFKVPEYMGNSISC